MAAVNYMNEVFAIAKQWKYYILDLPDDGQLSDYLMGLGDYGWELICYVPKHDIYIFKQPKDIEDD